MQHGPVADKVCRLTRLAVEGWRPSPQSDAALHELLDTCAARGIQAVLLVMPESSTLRGWYPPGVRAAFSDYTLRLARQYRTGVVDAGDWLPEDDFLDPFHLLLRGAGDFSGRFGREVLAPLLAGQPLPPSPATPPGL
jgi:hypothetical protein